MHLKHSNHPRNQIFQSKWLSSPWKNDHFDPTQKSCPKNDSKQSQNISKLLSPCLQNLLAAYKQCLCAWVLCRTLRKRLRPCPFVCRSGQHRDPVSTQNSKRQWNEELWIRIRIDIRRLDLRKKRKRKRETKKQRKRKKESKSQNVVDSLKTTVIPAYVTIFHTLPFSYVHTAICSYVTIFLYDYPLFICHTSIIPTVIVTYVVMTVNQSILTSWSK